MKRTRIIRTAGFTIVELLVVVVAIAILAAITVASYNGITIRAKNSAVTTTTSNALKLFTMYRSENGSWPREGQADFYDYCLGKDFPLYQDSGASTNASPTLRQPRRACTNNNGSVRFEASWLSDTLGKYGTLPGPSSASFLQFSGLSIANPVYSTVPDNRVPSYTNRMGWVYPPNAPKDALGKPGTRYFITFALAGTDPSCGGIPNAQYDGQASQGWSRCVIMLESYE
ncbi:prepilin-type N-terminal cleavage/methylation domain-containing protein [Candidatus Saccharibacteria bacterium TM7i]|nr:prepilin-type N-terminal cleavage/methylation domain-containing protein [Candidatus Saccharibacteria bacterium TM7i]